MSSPILPLDAADLLHCLRVAFTLAQILYQTFCKPSGIALPIAARTSIRCRDAE